MLAGQVADLDRVGAGRDLRDAVARGSSRSLNREARADDAERRFSALPGEAAPAQSQRRVTIVTPASTAASSEDIRSTPPGSDFRKSTRAARRRTARRAPATMPAAHRGRVLVRERPLGRLERRARSRPTSSRHRPARRGRRRRRASHAAPAPAASRAASTSAGGRHVLGDDDGDVLADRRERDHVLVRDGLAPRANIVSRSSSNTPHEPSSRAGWSSPIQPAPVRAAFPGWRNGSAPARAEARPAAPRRAPRRRPSPCRSRPRRSRRRASARRAAPPGAGRRARSRTARSPRSLRGRCARRSRRARRAASCAGPPAREIGRVDHASRARRRGRGSTCTPREPGAGQHVLAARRSRCSTVSRPNISRRAAA